MWAKKCIFFPKHSVTCSIETIGHTDSVFINGHYPLDSKDLVPVLVFNN